ncbi:MAG TPA: glycosyltransferase family 2 protein [Candidatus Angelobacter sp.]|nr:glycosyltransferase family 2 protein [Candidatus Angelobacter sp.]
MRQNPSIGVCIPTRNQSEFVTDALSSAFAQTVLPVDVVVSDDAGTDDTAKVVEQFRATLSPELSSRLRYSRSQEPLGIGGNFDRAVRLAEGDFVVKLDSDDILEPDFIKILADQLEANPRAGWAHCNVFNVRSDLSLIGLAHTRKKAGFYAASDALPAYLNHNDTCHCVLLRKSAYVAVGGYRSQMKTAEDWLLWLEMLFAGWGYVFDERPLARMRKYEARSELMTRRRQAFVESAYFMIPRMEVLCRQVSVDGLPAEKARSRFRATLAWLCVSSGCDEADSQVRRKLFESGYEFHPSWGNRIWREAGLRLPASSTRRLLRWAGLPRHCARAVIQKLRRK